ncbi:MAG: LysR family transcriptional regulator [Phreatobacter sp.]|nr:LysR family transcriptional regulator [Phreatobacter sp.]
MGEKTLAEGRNALRRLDITLLLVFLGMMRHRKSSDVARELGLTQPAISQALKRLREIFRDELFLRRSHGMEPTALALGLEPSVTQAVESLRAAVALPRRFDPAEAQGLIRIAAFDAEQVVILPRLVSLLALKAPGLKLSVQPFDRQAAVDALMEGEIDVAVGTIWNPPPAVLLEKMYDEEYRVVGRPDTLQNAQRLSIEDYCSAAHVLVSFRGTMTGIVDETLELRGLRRDIKVGVPSFLTALIIVAETGMIATVPASVAEGFAEHFRLRTACPPIEIRRFPVSVFWHRRHQGDPRIGWLCDRVREGCPKAIPPS